MKKMKIEIIKGADNNPVAEFFSSSCTPETDAVREDIGMGCMMVDSDFARKLERQRDEVRHVLSEISLYLSVGMGDESTTANQYYERILEGIKMLTDPIMENWKQAEKKLEEAIEALLKIDEIYIDGDDTYEDRIKMGKIAREVLDKIYLKNES